MGFVRLSSYLYGMYFLNAKINSELSMHVTDMKRMINAYHALVSLLMSKKQKSEYNARDHMRLFMSKAHYAHLNFGNFSDSENDANKNINQLSNKSNEKANDLVQSISREDILELLDRFRYPNSQWHADQQSQTWKDADESPETKTQRYGCCNQWEKSRTAGTTI